MKTAIHSQQGTWHGGIKTFYGSVPLFHLLETHKYTVLQNAELLNVKLGGTASYRCALKGLKPLCIHIHKYHSCPHTHVNVNKRAIRNLTTAGN